MARARNIKPAFFANEQLGELPPITRLLFIGLWTVADCDGRLEDRPKRLRAELLPYDDVDVDALLDALQAAGLIVRYQVSGQRYIEIPTFRKHQNPHPNEKTSEIPAPPCDSGKIMKLHEESGNFRTNPAESLLLNPESLVMNPEALTPLPPTGGASGADGPEHVDVDDEPAQDAGSFDDGAVPDASGAVDFPDYRDLDQPDDPPPGEPPVPELPVPELPPGVKPFDRFWAAYPRKVGKAAAAKAWGRLRPDAATLDRMLTAIAEQRGSEQWRRENGRFIPHPATWLNQGRWEDEPVALDAGPPGDAETPEQLFARAKLERLQRRDYRGWEAQEYFGPEGEQRRQHDIARYAAIAQGAPS